MVGTQSLQEQIKKYELMIELELRQSKEGAVCIASRKLYTSEPTDYLKELEKVRQELHVKRTVSLHFSLFNSTTHFLTLKIQVEPFQLQT